MNDADRELLRRNLASDQQDWLPLPAQPETVRVRVTWSESTTYEAVRELDASRMRRLGYDPTVTQSIALYLDAAYEFVGDDFYEWHSEFSTVARIVEHDEATMERVEIEP